MTDLLDLFDRGIDTFGARVHAVSPEQWSAPTPAAKWSVRDLVGHLVNEHLWVAPLLDGHSLDAAGRIVAAAERTDAGDPMAQWDAAALQSSRALREPGALERTVELSSGSTPVPDYAREMIMDLAVHSWDLGRAIGMTEPLPADLVTAALRHVDSYGGDLTGSMFAAPRPVPDGATDEDGLVARTGRDPRWTPPAGD